jgi:hypothetical protein
MKISLEINCTKTHCGKCGRIIGSAGNWIPLKPFCGVFAKGLTGTRQKDYKRLPECIKAEAVNESAIS